MKLFSNKKIREIRFIFVIENWLWKSEIGTFWPFNLECMLIYQKKCEKVLFSYHLMLNILNIY